MSYSITYKHVYIRVGRSPASFLNGIAERTNRFRGKTVYERLIKDVNYNRFDNERSAKRRETNEKIEKNQKKSGRLHSLRLILRLLRTAHEYKPHTGGFEKSRATRIKYKSRRKGSESVDFG